LYDALKAQDLKTATALLTNESLDFSSYSRNDDLLGYGASVVYFFLFSFFSFFVLTLFTCSFFLVDRASRMVATAYTPLLLLEFQIYSPN